MGGVLLSFLIGELINIFASVYLSNQAASMYGGAGSGISVDMPFWLFSFALVFSTLIGLISGLYPALRAASLVPVKALKYE